MTNYEKYKNEIIDLISDNLYLAVKNNMPIDCEKIENCKECDLRINDCDVARRNWLNAEYKEPITLTEREHAFCVAIGEGYLCKDRDGCLSICDVKPAKGITHWHYGGRANMNGCIYGFLFDFIKWEDEEPYSIEELLKLPVKEGE